MTTKEEHSTCDTNEKAVEANDLLLLSHILVEHKYSTGDVQTCLSLMDSDVYNTQTGLGFENVSPDVPNRKLVHQLLCIWWEKRQLTATWSSLLSCCEALEESESLMNFIHGEPFESRHVSRVFQQHQEEDDSESVFHQNSCVPYAQQSICKPQKISNGVLVTQVPSDPADSGGLIREARVNMRKHQRKFASLLRKAYVALCEKPEVTESLPIFLTQLCADVTRSFALFEKRTLAIISRSTVEEIFLLMSQMGAWDFVNYDLLENIIYEFELENLSQQMVEYKQDLSTFMDETVLSDYVTVWGGSRDLKSMSERTTIIAKLTNGLGNCTLADVAEQKRNLASEFHLTPLVIQFETVHSESNCIIWSVPLSTSVYMRKMIESSSRPDLIKYGIQEFLPN